MLLYDPDIPLPTSSCSTSGQASDLTVSGSQIYVADGSADLEILNVTDAFGPVTELVLTDCSRAVRHRIRFSNIRCSRQFGPPYDGPYYS